MYSSGELVADFLRYKLSQRGHNWRWLCEQNGAAGLGTQPEPGAAVCNGRPEAERARQALLDAAEEFELRYRRAFSDLSAQLRVTPDTAYRRFEQVVGELFRDGVNWGRLVAFFCFGAALSVESAEKEMGALVPRIADWMSTYLENNLDPWIRQHGGWVRALSSFMRQVPTLQSLGIYTVYLIPNSDPKSLTFHTRSLSYTPTLSTQVLNAKERLALTSIRELADTGLNDHPTFCLIQRFYLQEHGDRWYLINLDLNLEFENLVFSLFLSQLKLSWDIGDDDEFHYLHLPLLRQGFDDMENDSQLIPGMLCCGSRLEEDL
ncbi:uncharacterized protein LOC125481026 [Rhincodon typus]|uniref:uncharacterized protein LOC125481026 n=1 Tax=Rhincodon typus TaxID=259920 RepID=UPI00202E77D5|nr:uncharacterized protein LOC125481026 [Rhincodon typus]